ncbi:MAG: aminopeptidase [Verrucomicrobiota bacterium]
MGKIIIIPTLLLALSFVTGCSTLSYYGQAIDGQLEINQKQEKNKILLADPETPKELKRKLALIAEITAFADSQLDLPAGKNYTSYADLNRPHVVWTVFAAPDFSLEPKKWWYPFVGELSYRGYFAEQDARTEADALRAKGYDVFIAEVDAYSTLGWFNDPVLNTFVHDPDTDLAELIFHELTHRKIYLSGETNFNEALATAVAEEGVRRWLKSRNQTTELMRYERDLKRRRTVFALIDDTRKKLEILYARPNLTEAEKRVQKQALLDSLAQRHRSLLISWSDGEPLNRDPIAEIEVNNAFLNAVDTYHRMVPEFETLFVAYNEDFPTFFKNIKRHRRSMTPPPHTSR